MPSTKPSPLPPLLQDLQTHVPLALYTTWRIGGRARWFCEPAAHVLPELFACCQQHGIASFYLGRGSNTLVSDETLDGVVICLKQALQTVEQRGDSIVAEAGVPLPALAQFAASLGYGGYEFLIGIPGTVGAGVVMNAGAGLENEPMTTISDRLIDADIVTPAGEVRTLTADELHLGNRESKLLQTRDFVLRARFRLAHQTDERAIKKRTAAHLKARKHKQPLSKQTAGSTFKQSAGKKAAGWYIERAGLKGFSIGGARVNDKHANWIENTGSASAADIRALIEHIQDVVEERFAFRLEREVRYLPQDVAQP